MSPSLKTADDASGSTIADLTTSGALKPGLALETVTQDDAWPVSVLEAEFHDRIAAAIGRVLEFDAHERAVVAFANDAAVKTLNNQYRGQDKSTNVLSFPALSPTETDDAVLDDEAAFLGDIILARETVAREAGEQDVSFEHHTAHLIIHGILHLLGYDHEDEPTAEEMEALEIIILADLGIANPYTEELDDAV
ncbi:MAG: putative rRNA maturation factor [Hyphomicrobiaceae bacterium]|jgi:probable rRNA maturation factor